MRLTRFDLGIALVLTAGSVAAFGPAFRAGFIAMDDPVYVTGNRFVVGGLTAENVARAWTSLRASNWHPLTWMSLQLDASLWGAGPLGFHATNVALHAANAVLVYLALGALTGWRGRSAFVAALFAVHPLRVESVVWISERKDVLSSFFGLLALWAYAHYAAAPSVRRYLPVVLGLVLSLLAKPMLVTLPFLLLVLDWWPLGRDKISRGSMAGSGDPATTHVPASTGVKISDRRIVAGFPRGVMARPLRSVMAGSPRDVVAGSPDPATGPVRAWMKLAAEKLPLIVFCLASCAITLYVQRQGGAVASLGQVPFYHRLNVAIVAYATYLGLAVWPFGLAPYYPFPMDAWPAERVGIAMLVLVGLTALALWQRRKRPYLLAGWLWYLGTLVPVVGLVQVGGTAYADRYTYFPLIGPALSVVWWIAEATARVNNRVVMAAATVVLLGLATLTWSQANYWHDDLLLWPHTLKVTPRNAIAESNLGAVLEKDQANIAEATKHYARAVEFLPNYGPARYNLARTLAAAGRADEAIVQYRKALQATPLLPEAENDLAVALGRKGMNKEAEEHYRRALEIDPEFAMAHHNLGKVLELRGQSEEALEHYRAAVHFDPADGVAHGWLGVALAQRGDLAQAVGHLQLAAKLQPRSAPARYNLAIALEKFGQKQEAADFFQQAVELDPKDVRNRLRLATALTRLGHTGEAEEQYREALRLDPRWPEEMSRQAWNFATSPNPRERDGELAVWAGESVCNAIRPPPVSYLDALAAAYAEAGRFSEATATAEKAIAAAEAANQPEAARAIAGRLALYREQRPFHRPPPAPR